MSIFWRMWWVLVTTWFALSLYWVIGAHAEERFGEDAGWQLVEKDKVTKFATENDCWHAYFGSGSLRPDAYCEPEKKWVMVEQSKLGVDTTGFKSELGCFISGVVASHQQGVEASCQHLGDTAGR